MLKLLYKVKINRDIFENNKTHIIKMKLLLTSALLVVFVALSEARGGRGGHGGGGGGHGGSGGGHGGGGGRGGQPQPPPVAPTDHPLRVGACSLTDLAAGTTTTNECATDHTCDVENPITLNNDDGTAAYNVAFCRPNLPAIWASRTPSCVAPQQCIAFTADEESFCLCADPEAGLTLASFHGHGPHGSHEV